jgi:SAM-dependent methyltransferase
VNFCISQEAYPYLVTQRGALDDMKGDPVTWCRKYAEVLRAEFQSIEPYLPRHCDSVLDVGSGLGGIDALINDHYGGEVSVCLLDGVDDPPVCTLHAKTFNHMGVARQFLKDNGVRKMTYIDANDAHRFTLRTFDLVISFKSWCFHTPPAAHLDLVRQACHQGTRLIVDVRREHLYEYMRALTGPFRHQSLIHYGLKFETHEFTAP